MDEHLELVRVAHEEDRGVVAHHVPVAFVRIELDRKPAHIALGVGRTTFARHGREAGEDIRLPAHFGQEGGLGVFRNVVRDGEGAVRPRSFGVHRALGNALAVEVLYLLQQLHVLHEQRAAWPGGQGLLRRDGRAICRRKLGILTHSPCLVEGAT